MIIRDDDKLKRTVASNIAHYRRACGLTQAELAERIFYSDKSVSKWERAEGLPDVCVLVMLAELFGVTVNDLVYERTEGAAKKPKPKMRRGLITLMSFMLVWLAAATAFFSLRIAAPEIDRAWLAFIVAVPASFIVTTVLTTIWYPLLPRFLSVSALIWSIAMAIDICVSIDNIHLIYIVAAVVQVLAALWYLFIAAPKLSGRKPLIVVKHKRDAAADPRGGEDASKTDAENGTK